MLKEATVGKTVYVVTGYTGMKKGIDGLAEIIQGKLTLLCAAVNISFLSTKSKQTERIFAGELLAIVQVP